MGTRREGRGTEAGKREGDRERVREREIVWREGGRDSRREWTKERVKEICTACILWKGRERKGERERERKSERDSGREVYTAMLAYSDV